jgi:hypothetical protein
MKLYQTQFNISYITFQARHLGSQDMFAAVIGKFFDVDIGGMCLTLRLEAKGR